MTGPKQICRSTADHRLLGAKSFLLAKGFLPAKGFRLAKGFLPAKGFQSAKGFLPAKGFQSAKGFTVVELMVGVAVMAILAAVAAPSLTQFLTRQKINAQSEEIGRTFAVARAESLSRLQDISVCWNPSDSNVTQSGVVIEPDHMAVLDPSGGVTEVIRYVEYTGEGLFIVEDEADNCAIIDTQGRLDLDSVSGNSLVFGVCEESGEVKDSRSIVVANTGRATVDKNVQTDGTNTINCS